MLASGRALGFSAGWPGALRRGLIVVYSSASDVKSFHVCFRYGIVLAEFIRSFLSFFYLPAEVVFLFAMGSRATNNSLQTAPILSTPLTGQDDVVNALSTSPAGGSLKGLPSASHAVDASGKAGISPAIASLIAQTVWAALAVERANSLPSSLASTPPIPSVSSPSAPSSTASACSGGVPPLLSSSTNAFLTAGAGFAGPSLAGRPTQFMSPVVPSFVSTFASPSMSAFSSASAYNLPTGATRDVADRPAVHASPVVDQPVVVGPGFSPVPAKLVAQIVAGKYVDLSELLAVNLVQKDPEPQLLLDGRLVLTSQPKKQRRRIEDIASWMEAFAIFSLILVSSFPHRWKDLMQYQLLILRTYRHFSGRVWLAYDQAFREHAAATRLTDWSAMNVQLFNFHAAGSSVRSSSLATSNESPEPPGSSSSVILCKSWNKGRCTAPFSFCRYAHRCSVCSGAHRASSCTNQSSKDGGDRIKRRSRSPSVSGSGSHAKARRS